MSMRALQEPSFLILTALAAGAQHGYGIMNDVAEISGGRVKLHAGTLYAALDRLSAEGLVDTDREEVVAGRLRRYYRLTPPGGERLASEVERLRSHTDVATRRLRLAGARREPGTHAGGPVPAAARPVPGRAPGRAR